MRKPKAIDSLKESHVGAKDQSKAEAKTDDELIERVAVLELKVAYHERLNQDLSDQVYSLHREIDLLRRGINTLKQALERRDEEGLNIGPADDPPPHY